jgi:hypothetical protein
MSRRSLSQSSFFDPLFADPSCLEVGSVPWLLAREGADLFPAWITKGWRGEQRKGRDAWPATVLLTLLLLRWSEEGMSRLGSTKLARVDIAWRAAMGLRIGTPTPHEKTVREFEAFLRDRHADCDVSRYLLLHEHIIRRCMAAGVANESPIWSMDSTPMWCYGAVKDTVRLLGDGLRVLGGRWASTTETPLATVATRWGLPLVRAKSVKGYFQINWSDADARAGVVTELAGDVVRVVEWVRTQIGEAPRGARKGILKLCKTLTTVIVQNLEPDAEGRLVIAQKVVRDRIISLTDTEARHGRKSKSQTFNGFKVHVLGDVVSGLLTAVSVTPGNVHDGTPAVRLLSRAKALVSAMDRVLGDTAYGGARDRHVARGTLGITLVTPPPAVSTDSKTLPKRQFTPDFKADTLTCPDGLLADRRTFVHVSDHDVLAPRFSWEAATCAGCPLRTACVGESNRGRGVVLHPYERDLREIRAEWERPETRTQYRRRSECERLVNQLTRHGARRARAFGLRKANLQVHLIAMRCNLQLLATAVAEAEVKAAA